MTQTVFPQELDSLAALRLHIMALCTPVFQREEGRDGRPIPVFEIDSEDGPRNHVAWPMHSHFVFARLKEMAGAVDIWADRFGADTTLYNDIVLLDSASKVLMSEALWLDTRDRNSWENCRIAAGFHSDTAVFAAGAQRMQDFWKGGYNLRAPLTHDQLTAYYGLEQVNPDVPVKDWIAGPRTENRVWAKVFEDGVLSLRFVPPGPRSPEEVAPKADDIEFLRAKRPVLTEHSATVFDFAPDPQRVKAAEADLSPSP